MVKIGLHEFAERKHLIQYVHQLSFENEKSESIDGVQIDTPLGGWSVAQSLLAQIDPAQYSQDRNYFDGHVTHLSPYIRHGLLAPRELQERLQRDYAATDSVRLLQQLTWRDYFHRYLEANPQAAWQDVEPYKTGYAASDYLTVLPQDIMTGQTGVRVIDQMIVQLLEQGWLHNHARLYLAAYIVHWRKVSWQAGARWFLQHLLDGDLASNNLSWQWVASTFSAKPYFFNLANLQQFSRGCLEAEDPTNAIFDQSYDELRAFLFPLAAKEIWQ
ncbi:deoxyribodipyrimidine photo-lyase [Thiosulfatimonas sediminis]|uniref:Deoxyribodipyrimidine photo-lyase n=1 Tax=Thiosulfatimonas sediminis TaxID=2675054 RepID=A0A6F8PSX8_9GAMM|nr:FAD-binding domain-containing protein [Thiosulfatimonas sediminis]BBP45231.1 deoxyribodipyrimidine photo-lyase [Thiosulfatimonas sediminis]